MPLSVSLVPCLDDNYGFLVRDEETGATAAVDTPDAGPILDALKERGWALDIILNTHKHGDHIGGNQALRERTGAMVVGPGEVAERTHVDWVVKGGDCVSLGATEFFVIDTGGHTLGHVSYYASGAATVFVGDTLFAMGCGRLFEGTAEQMHHSLQRLVSLPGDTALYCGHEYTLANARFAIHAEPGNAAIAARLNEVEALREAGAITLPTTAAQERETNVFVRATKVEEFARLRAEKDSFRS